MQPTPENRGRLTFVIDVCEWRDGAPERRWRDGAAGRLWPIEERARLGFADEGNRNAARNRDFFFHAFDTWVSVVPGTEMRKLFRLRGDDGDALPLLVSTSPDLFGACISKYGTSGFTYAEALLLLAVLLARQAGEAISTEQLARRLRTLRNIAESAFLDSTRMVEYVSRARFLQVPHRLVQSSKRRVEVGAPRQRVILSGPGRPLRRILLLHLPQEVRGRSDGQDRADRLPRLRRCLGADQ